MYFFIQNIDHLVLLSGFPLFAVDEEKLTWNSSKNFIRLPVDFLILCQAGGFL